MEQVDDWVKSASTDETTDFLRAAQMRSSYVKQHPKPKSAGHGAHSSDDYGDIATNYVKRRTWSQRMQERAHGVAEVLADRLGHDPMEDVPVITRADGTEINAKLQSNITTMLAFVWVHYCICKALCSIWG